MKALTEWSMTTILKHLIMWHKVKNGQPWIGCIWVRSKVNIEKYPLMSIFMLLIFHSIMSSVAIRSAECCPISLNFFLTVWGNLVYLGLKVT